MRENITEHFTVTEMTDTSFTKLRRANYEAFCASFDSILNMTRLCTVLEFVRVLYGRPIIINSGFRSEELNKAVGGVSNSLHKIGCAADLLYDVRLVEILTTFKRNGWLSELIINRAKQYIHVAVPRPKF